MTETATVDGLLKIATIFAGTVAPARPKLWLSALLGGALLKGFAFSCFGAAMFLALVAIGMQLAPVLGAAGAVAADAVVVGAIGLAAFVGASVRTPPRAPTSPGSTPEVLLAQISQLLEREKGLFLEREKGLSVVAGLLVGVLAAGSRN